MTKSRQRNVVIRAKQCAPGILALLEISNRQAETLQASDLGFSVAPRP